MTVVMGNGNGIYSIGVKIFAGVVLAAIISWGAWVTASTFNTNNSRFTAEQGAAITEILTATQIELAVQDQRFKSVESDIREIKDAILRLSPAPAQPIQ